MVIPFALFDAYDAMFNSERPPDVKQHHEIWVE